MESWQKHRWSSRPSLKRGCLLAALAACTWSAPAAAVAASQAGSPRFAARSAPTRTPTPASGAPFCGDEIVYGGETCDDGNNVGGDGCAANCTTEVKLVLDLGSEEQSQSRLAVQTAFFRLDLVPSGSLLLLLGTPRTEVSLGSDGFTNFAPGIAPVSVPIQQNRGLLPPIKVPGLACACLRGAEPRSCGGLPLHPGDDTCTDDAPCPQVSPCRPAFGADVSAAGVVGCSEIDDVDYLETTHGGENRTEFVRSGGWVDLGAMITSFVAIDLIADDGSCRADPGNPAKGADGVACTDDDPSESRGTPRLTALTTGTATAFVLGANGQLRNIDDASACGAAACVTSATGAAVGCEQLFSASAAGLCLATAFAISSVPTGGDAIVSGRLCGLGPEGTPTPTPTPPPATAAPTPTATACGGDCNGDGVVDVADLVEGVRIALCEIALDACETLDVDGDDVVTIDELTLAVIRRGDACAAPALR